MGSTLPKKKSTAATHAIRQIKDKPKGRSARKDRTKEGWTRKRLDYAELEAKKILVETILYKDVVSKRGVPFKVEWRFAILPQSGSGYLDIRKYMNGRPTGQGAFIHLERFDDFIAAINSVRVLVSSMKANGTITPDGASKNLRDDLRDEPESPRGMPPMP